MWNRIVLGAIGLLFVVVLEGCELSSTPPPALSQNVKSMAISQITGYPEVVEAAIIQKDRTLSLVVVVAAGTSERRAKELGDNLVRLVKTFGPEEPPSQQQIGRGMYDYLVGVYYSNEQRIAQGAKASRSRRINW